MESIRRGARNGVTTTGPAMIPGVMDGVVTVLPGADGTVSLHISLPGGGDQIELIIGGAHVAQLGSALAGGRLPVQAPCSVGVRRIRAAPA
jgi:hypothetical protein